jgi:hypothetical protein
MYLYSVIFDGLTATVVLEFPPTVTFCLIASVFPTLLYEYALWENYMAPEKTKIVWYKAFNWTVISGIMTMVVLASISALVSILITPHLSNLYL